MTQNIEDGAPFWNRLTEISTARAGRHYGTFKMAESVVCWILMCRECKLSNGKNPSAMLQPNYIFIIFISPPSLKELEERLIGRGTKSAESLARRTANARQEMEYGMEERATWMPLW
jgi:hypothetical protein